MRKLLPALLLIATGVQATPCDETDTDGDGVPNRLDNCVEVKNTTQWDNDEDGIGNYCDTDLDGDKVTTVIDGQMVLNIINARPGDPNWNPLLDLYVDDWINVIDAQLPFNRLGLPPGPSCIVGKFDSDDIQAANGILTIGATTIEVNPQDYGPGESLAWQLTTMPYQLDGFVEQDRPVTWTSSVDTRAVLSISYDGPGIIMWPTLLPGALDREGDYGPWVAPRSSTSREAGVWRIETSLYKGVPETIAPAAASYEETEVQYQTVHLHWRTPSGNYPTEAAIVENAVKTFLEWMLEDSACTMIPTEMTLIVMPSRILSGQPNFIARYAGDNTLYFNPQAFTRGLPALERYTTHETAHAVAITLLPSLEKFLKSPELLPLLVFYNSFTEAYGTAYEIERYKTPVYNGWTKELAPWPDYWSTGFEFDGNPLGRLRYHLGYPLSRMIDSGHAPTLCEFWKDPALIGHILAKTTVDYMDNKAPGFNKEWAKFVDKWNRNREEFGHVKFGLAPPIPIAPTLQGPVSQNLCDYGNGRTVKLYWDDNDEFPDDLLATRYLSYDIEKSAWAMVAEEGSSGVSSNPITAPWYAYPVTTNPGNYFVTFASAWNVESTHSFAARQSGVNGPQCQ